MHDHHVSGSSELLSPLPPYVRGFAVSLDAVKHEVSERLGKRDGVVRQRASRGKLWGSGVEELECIGDMSIKLGKCDRPSGSVACWRKILLIKRNTAASPYRSRPAKHSSAI